MEKESLEDHLRRATRNFSARLPEERAVTLAAELARELARAHAESPPRHPDLDPATVGIADGHPRLDRTSSESPAPDVAEDLFRLGGVLYFMATGERPDVSWRLDGPPAGALSTLARQAALIGLSAPRGGDRFASAGEAASSLEAAVAPVPTGAPPWPMFRGDASRRGARPAAAPSASLSVAWEARVGAVTASPILTSSLAIAPTADGRLVFLDRASGRRVHEMRLASAVESSPALSGRVLHVGTDEGEVVGVDVVDGTERYRVRLARLVRSSPLPWQDRLVVGTVDDKGAGSVAALDAAKGKLLWMRKTGPVFSSPARAGDTILVGSDDGSVYALDPARGTVSWAERLGAKVRATLAVAEDVAIAADFEGRVVALRVKDGTRAWTADLGHAVYSSPCLAVGLCVVGCHEGHVHGLDARTGAARFQAQTRGPVIGSPVAAGERFLVASTDGTLYLLDAEGRVLHQVSLSSQGVQSSLALGEDGGAVVVGSAEGLHGLRLTP
jgi:outer membrane protein assembly factor BamB